MKITKKWAKVSQLLGGTSYRVLCLCSEQYILRFWGYGTAGKLNTNSCCKYSLFVKRRKTNNHPTCGLSPVCDNIQCPWHCLLWKRLLCGASRRGLHRSKKYDQFRIDLVGSSPGPIQVREAAEKSICKLPTLLTRLETRSVSSGVGEEKWRTVVSKNGIKIIKCWKLKGMISRCSLLGWKFFDKDVYHLGDPFGGKVGSIRVTRRGLVLINCVWRTEGGGGSGHPESWAIWSVVLWTLK